MLACLLLNNKCILLQKLKKLFLDMRLLINLWHTSYLLIFSPLHSFINREQYEKHLYNQSSQYRKYGIFNCRSMCPIFWLKSRCVTWPGVFLCFISLPALQTLWVTFQAKNNIRSTPASTTLTQVSHWSHNTHIANCHLSGSGERN